MNPSERVGFLGAGRMAKALAQGFARAGLVKPEHVIASDPVEGARQAFSHEVQASVTPSNLEVVRQSTLVFLAVKPQQAAAVLHEIKPAWDSTRLLVSIAAGLPLAKIEAVLPDGARVIRVMPNTPALVGASASAYARGLAAQPQDAQTVQRLLSAVGLAFEVEERLLDAVTGLSGSGPAYGFLMIEALSDGGVAAGLPRDLALKLAAQTLLGSARMVLETGLHPGALKDMVTSPGGTTIEGLHALEQAGVRSALISAVRNAAEKSKRLGQS